MGMYRQRMPDREVSAEMTKADYWEVQADMWHENYKEAADEIERLRGVLLTVLEACEDVNSPDRKVRVEITKRCREALKEKE